MMKEEHRPLDISRIMHLPRRKLQGFTVRIKNVPGVLVKVSSILARNNINILNCIFSYTYSDIKEATMLFFCDVTESIKDVNEVRGEILKVSEVLEAKLIKPYVDEILADVVHHPLMSMGRRVVLFDERLLRGLVMEVKRRFGSGGDAILFYVGKGIGRELLREPIIKDKSWPREKVLGISQLMMFVSGWGMLEVSEVDWIGKRARVKVYDSWECRIGVGGEKPFSQLYRGLISGLFSSVFKADVSVLEVKCVAKGDSYCEFEVSAT